MQPVLILLTTCGMLGLFLMAFLHAPIEATMGWVQKIFYFHVPAAYAMYLSWGICAAASVGYLVKREERLDLIAASAAEVALLFASVVMITGPLWGRKAWGAFWTFDPRLTATLLFALIIVSYVLLRTLSQGERERRFAAALSILGAAVLPVIHVAVNKWRGQHPQLKRGGLDPAMHQTLLVGFGVFTLLSVLLVLRRYGLEKHRMRLAHLREEAAVRGIGEAL